MNLESFLLEYGGSLFGCFAVGWAIGHFWLAIKRAIEIIF